MSQRRKRAYAVVAAVGTVLIVVASLGVLSLAAPGSPALPPAAAAGAQATGTTVLAAGPSGEVEPVQPAEPALADPTMDDIENVVVLLADDMDWALFDGVPRLAALKEQGTTLTNFVVTDSLCCPSRASILRSQYVHNHGVLSNVPRTGGGWATFRDRGLEEDCLATWLQDAGVSTALVGKYLNGFGVAPRTKRYVPAGWDHFVTSPSGNQAYRGFDYQLNVNGTIVTKGSGPDDFLNDVLTTDATTWLRETTEPFFLLFSSYNPHVPAPTSARNAGSHAGATVPQTGAFNARGQAEPRWLRKVPSLGPKGIARLNGLWTRRLESAESIADSYEAIVQELEQSGRLDSTLIIVTSDNGYHAGARRLPTGKQTPFQEDSVVPTVLIGPGIPKGQVIDRMTSTIDLGPTIASLLGARTPAWTDGRSMLPLLQDPAGFPWRNGVLLESLAAALPGDPDYTAFDAPVFRALRTPGWLYVEYSGGEVGLYDRVNDPAEIDNVVAQTSPLVVAQLRAQLRALARCEGPSCRTADMMTVPAPVARTAASPVG